MNLKIKDWKEDDRPREKLLIKGKTALSDAELIAVLIGSGNKNENAVSLSKRILGAVDHNLNELGKLEVVDLTRFPGIGPAKAIAIITALELGRRRRLENALKRTVIRSSKDVFDLMQPVLGDLKHEEFWILFLNNSNKVLYRDRISQGGLTGTVVDGRIVFKKALEIGATALILCHNHPSGSLKPSRADDEITSKLKSAGQVLEIKVLDHLIVTGHSYYSFADENRL